MSTATATASDVVDAPVRCQHGPVEDPDEAVMVFLAERKRLLRVAYGVVRDVAAAEDVVQEAWLRWQGTDRQAVRNPAAFLTTVTTRVGINLVQTAWHRREVPTGSPVESSNVLGDVADHAVQTVAVDRLLEVLMAKLTAAELAALLLRKCFGYPYQEIADALGTSSPNARQLVHRAASGVVSRRAHGIDRAAQQRLVEAFVCASETGDVAMLVDLLADGVSAARETRTVAA